MGERRQRSGRRSKDMANIASERIAILFTEAEKAARRGEEALSGRYVSLARAIGMRYNVRFPPGLKRRACQKCGAFLVPGRNLRVRFRNGKTVRTCLKCGKVSRVWTKKRERTTGEPVNR